LPCAGRVFLVWAMKRRLTNSGKIGPDGLGRKNYRWHSQTAAIFQISWSAERTYVKHEKVGLASFDHLVGAREERRRQVEAEGLGGLEVNHRFPPMPSIVVTARLPVAPTGNRQERTGLPSICTVQAPHCAMPQPNLVLVMPSTSRAAPKATACQRTR